MTAFDLMAIGVVGLSTVFAFWRGFVRVAVSLVAWVVAVVAALYYSAAVGAVLPEFGGSAVARYIAAFALILVGVLILGALAGWILSKLVRAIGLGFIDRIFGALLGIARGVLIVVVGVLLVGLTALPRLDWWQNSLFAPSLVMLSLTVRPWLPQAWSERLDFGPAERPQAKPVKKAAASGTYAS